MNDKIAESIADILKTRSIITLMVYGTSCILALMNKPLPPMLEWGCYALFGIWFGEKIYKFGKNQKGGV